MAAIIDRLRAGLGGMPASMFPVPAELESQLDPETLRRLRQQAMLQMGLGMMAAGEKGAGLGTGVLYGMNQGREGLGQGVNQAWVAKRSQREDERLDWYQKKAEEDRERQTRLDRVAMSDRIRGRMNERERLEMERERLRLSQEAALRDGRLTPYQAETLRLQQEALGRERERERRVNELIKAQRKYKRGSDGWQLLQDEIDNVSGRSVDRSVGDGLGLDMGGAAAPDLSGFLKEEAPVQRPPPAAATAPAPAVAPQAGLGAPARPLPEAAYRSVPEINAAITGGTARAVTKADNYTARLNQKLLAKMEGISWEEWRSRNGFPPP